MDPFAREPAFVLPSLVEAGNVAARLVVAAALAGALGYEREREGKAAGLRTHMLVALGSALFIVASLLLPATLTPWTYLFATMDELGTHQGSAFSGSALATHLQNGQLAMADFLTAAGATGVAGYKSGTYSPAAHRRA